MGKLYDFLLAGETGERTMEVTLEKIPHPFTVRSITEKENREIRKSCQQITFNKRTHQKETETDTDLYLNRLVIACCVEPNWKDATLQEHYGVRGAEALLETILTPGQFSTLLEAVQEINGFGGDMEEEIETAKN